MTFLNLLHSRLAHRSAVILPMLIAVLAVSFTGCESAAKRRARYDRQRSAILHATQGSERHLDERYEALENLDDWFYKRKDGN